MENDSVFFIIVIIVIVLVGALSLDMGITDMENQAIENGVGEYNSTNKKFQWKRK